MTGAQKSELVQQVRDALERDGVNVTDVRFGNDTVNNGFLIEFVDSIGVAQTLWLPLLEAETIEQNS